MGYYHLFAAPVNSAIKLEIVVSIAYMGANKYSCMQAGYMAQFTSEQWNKKKKIVWLFPLFLTVDKTPCFMDL